MPVRSLSSRHRPRVLAHLLHLSADDRFLRFGYQANDAQIGHYVDALDFEQDEVFGIFNRRLELVAMAHLAHHVEAEGAARAAEFGVSVLARYRGRGFGRRLFEHATLHARNRGVNTLLIHALTQNRAMLKIVRDAGAVIRADGSEATASLSLPEDTWATHVGEIAVTQAAEIDYRLKTQALNFNGLVTGLDELKSSLQGAKIASE
ncbi:MAG: GNAT family N-acetyltransferase [Burkholderiaceae bacterium]